jgi:thiamine-monophosphate kinase
VLGLTAIGRATGPVPSRSGARPGDLLWVSGTIGDAGAGLAALRRGEDSPLVERYRNPRPRLEAGERLVPMVSAMMDVSDGLLIDASRLAAASACGVEIELDSIPLSDGFPGAPREAATAGDDYELLFAAGPDAAAAILALGEEIGLPFSRIGCCLAGAGLTLTERGTKVPLPARLGFEHG